MCILLLQFINTLHQLVRCKKFHFHQYHHHHQIGSFNCLRLQQNKDNTTINCFPYPLSSSSSSSSLRRNHKAKESTSPKIGCFVQIKRNSSQKYSQNGSKKLTGIKRLFSLKGVEDGDQVCNKGVGIADTMDTPLHVFKNCVIVRDVNIWKRRHGGGAVLQHIDVGDVKLKQIQQLSRTLSGVARFEAHD